MSAQGLQLLPRYGTDEPTAIPGGVRIHGEREWKLHGPIEQLDDVQATLPASVAERLAPDLILLRFVNAVGRFTVPHLGKLEVVSGKWTENDFEQMLAQISGEIAALPFTAADLAKVPYDRSLNEHEEVLYQVFVYLRHILSDAAPRAVRLSFSLEAIVRDPHRGLESVTRRTPLFAASRIDRRYLRRLAEGAELLQPAVASLRGSPLVRTLRGYAPEEVDETHFIRSLDTAENRFVKGFLVQADGVVRRVEQHARRRSGRFWKRILSQCEEMQRTLGVHLRAPMWREVGVMTHLPLGSSVLQRRRGYSEIYQHFLRLRATTCIPHGRAKLEDLLEIKNIAELYELWCYFRVVRTLNETLGRRPRRARPVFRPTDVSVPWGFVVGWSGGVTCHYNLGFSSSHTSGRRSWSVGLRPDIAVWVPEGSNRGFHLLDAKFRLEKLESWADDEDAEVGTGEPRSTFKRTDLYKMHTYRDALPAVRSVRILYPGAEAKFYALDASESSAEGVGAVPLLPTSPTHPELRSVVSDLLSSSAAPR